MTEHSRKMFLNILVTLTLAVCELAGQDLHLQEPITNPPPNYRCVPMQDVDICSNIHIEYVNGSLPNYRNQDDLAVVNNELENFIPLIRRQCSNAIVHLLCSIYVPFCTNNDPQVLCMLVLAFIPPILFVFVCKNSSLGTKCIFTTQ